MWISDVEIPLLSPIVNEPIGTCINKLEEFPELETVFLINVCKNTLRLINLSPSGLPGDVLHEMNLEQAPPLLHPHTVSSCSQKTLNNRLVVILSYITTQKTELCSVEYIIDAREDLAVTHTMRVYPNFQLQRCNAVEIQHIDIFQLYAWNTSSHLFCVNLNTSDQNRNKSATPSTSLQFEICKLEANDQAQKLKLAANFVRAMLFSKPHHSIIKTWNYLAATLIPDTQKRNKRILVFASLLITDTTTGFSYEEEYFLVATHPYKNLYPYIKLNESQSSDGETSTYSKTPLLSYYKNLIIASNDNFYLCLYKPWSNKFYIYNVQDTIQKVTSFLIDEAPPSKHPESILISEKEIWVNYSNRDGWGSLFCVKYLSGDAMVQEVCAERMSLCLYNQFSKACFSHECIKYFDTLTGNLPTTSRVLTRENTHKINSLQFGLNSSTFSQLLRLVVLKLKALNPSLELSEIQSRTAEVYHQTIQSTLVNWLLHPTVNLCKSTIFKLCNYILQNTETSSPERLEYSHERLHLSQSIYNSAENSFNTPLPLTIPHVYSTPVRNTTLIQLDEEPVLDNNSTFRANGDKSQTLSAINQLELDPYSTCMNSVQRAIDLNAARTPAPVGDVSTPTRMNIKNRNLHTLNNSDLLGLIQSALKVKANEILNRMMLALENQESSEDIQITAYIQALHYIYKNCIDMELKEWGSNKCIYLSKVYSKFLFTASVFREKNNLVYTNVCYPKTPLIVVQSNQVNICVPLSHIHGIWFHTVQTFLYDICHFGSIISKKDNNTLLCEILKSQTEDESIETPSMEIEHSVSSRLLKLANVSQTPEWKFYLASHLLSAINHTLHAGHSCMPCPSVLLKDLLAYNSSLLLQKMCRRFEIKPIYENFDVDISRLFSIPLSYCDITQPFLAENLALIQAAAVHILSSVNPVAADNLLFYIKQFQTIPPVDQWDILCDNQSMEWLLLTTLSVCHSSMTLQTQATNTMISKVHAAAFSLTRTDAYYFVKFFYDIMDWIEKNSAMHFESVAAIEKKQTMETQQWKQNLENIQKDLHFLKKFKPLLSKLSSQNHTEELLRITAFTLLDSFCLLDKVNPILSASWSHSMDQKPSMCIIPSTWLITPFSVFAYALTDPSYTVSLFLWVTQNEDVSSAKSGLSIFMKAIATFLSCQPNKEFHLINYLKELLHHKTFVLNLNRLTNKFSNFFAYKLYNALKIIFEILSSSDHFFYFEQISGQVLLTAFFTDICAFFELKEGQNMFLLELLNQLELMHEIIQISSQAENLNIDMSKIYDIAVMYACGQSQFSAAAAFLNKQPILGTSLSSFVEKLISLALTGSMNTEEVSDCLAENLDRIRLLPLVLKSLGQISFLTSAGTTHNRLITQIYFNILTDHLNQYLDAALHYFLLSACIQAEINTEGLESLSNVIHSISKTSDSTLVSTKPLFDLELITTLQNVRNNQTTTIPNILDIHGFQIYQALQSTLGSIQADDIELLHLQREYLNMCLNKLNCAKGKFVFLPQSYMGLPLSVKDNNLAVKESYISYLESLTVIKIKLLSCWRMCGGSIKLKSIVHMQKEAVILSLAASHLLDQLIWSCKKWNFLVTLALRAFLNNVAYSFDFLPDTDPMNQTITYEKCIIPICTPIQRNSFWDDLQKFIDTLITVSLDQFIPLIQELLIWIKTHEKYLNPISKSFRNWLVQHPSHSINTFFYFLDAIVNSDINLPYWTPKELATHFLEYSISTYYSRRPTLNEVILKKVGFYDNWFAMHGAEKPFREYISLCIQ